MLLYVCQCSGAPSFMGAVMLSVIQFCHGNQQQGRRTCMVSILSFIIVILIISILCFCQGAEWRRTGRQKSKCRKPDKRKQDGPIHKSFSYAPSCHGKGSAFILYCLCRLFYISHKKPALSPGFHQSLSADLLLRNHRLGICRPLREGKREGCLSSDPPYDHSGHGVQICS